MPASQTATLQLFTALRLHRSSWAGSLLLSVGLNDSGKALALAALCAGAATLVLESDRDLLRAAEREGCCNFTVTTLDEALRALKNEVRQGRAIAVALHGDVAAHLAEMVERGVLPQALAVSRPPDREETSSFTKLTGGGCSALTGLGLCSVTDGGVALEALLHPLEADGWRIATQHADTYAERRSNDAALLANSTEVLHRCWLQNAPSLFPRSLERAYWSR